MVYSSKIEWWVGAILAIAPLLVLIQAVKLRHASAWIPVAVIAVVYGSMLWPVTYTLGESALVVRNGMMRAQIPYAAMESVQPTRNPLSATALSLDRLAIRYAGGRLALISLQNAGDFVQDLQMRAPAVKILPR